MLRIIMVRNYLFEAKALLFLHQSFVPGARHAQAEAGQEYG
jgi:hypothetical protein